MYRILCSILFLVLLTIGIAYFFVDRRVANRLARPNESQLSAIYSDSLSLNPAAGLSDDQLREQLIKRRYLETSDEPDRPGEFKLESSHLRIVTREFTGPDGRIRPAQQLVIDFSDRNLPRSVTLEPQILTVLGSSDIRANELRRLGDFPEYLRQAVVAIEDERFYSHHGIDLQGIARALVENIRAMGIVQGGSTITQQLAKNLFFSPQRSLTRKVKEALAAVSLELRLPKDQILEMYLNEVYLGQEGAVAIHGFAEAAKTFFGKRVEDLSLAQAALLAGVIKAPSYFSPRRNLARALERRNLTLTRMRELGYIDSARLRQALREKAEVLRDALHQRRAPHFHSVLEQELGSWFNPEAAIREGVRIYTGIDLDMQQCAEQAVAGGIKDIEKRFPALAGRQSPLEVGLVSIEPFSGKVRAWVGGRDYGANQFDHVAQARRQIGSTIKPFLYLTALDRRLNSYKVATAQSILSDRPVEIDLTTKKTWTPDNYDHRFRGDVTLRYALERSLNLPAVYTAERFGIAALARTVRAFHLGTDIQAVPALALGAADTNLLSLTAGYAGLANGGIYVAPRLFVTAVDLSGSPLANSPVQEEALADENAVYVLTNILQGVVERGTAQGVRRLGYLGPAAGKTGTSNDTRDAWFVGFTPDLATGVWLGFDDSQKIGLTGGTLAVPIWTDYMRCVSQFHAFADFVPPAGVVFVNIDGTSGELAGEFCPADVVLREVYVRGTEPRHSCRLHALSPSEEVALPEFEPAEQPRRRPERSLWDRMFDW